MAQCSPTIGTNGSMESPGSADTSGPGISQPTPAQRLCSDSSETSVKKLFVSEAQRVDVNESNVYDLFENLNGDNSQIIALQDLFHKLPKSDFISRNNSADEAQLEQLREVIFSEVRGLRDYPYPVSADLKRRIRRTRGETIAFKLASDIYQLVNILDGGPIEEIQNMISIPKSQSRSEFNSSLCGTQKNASNIDFLSSAVTQIQADLIKVKQDNVRHSKQLNDDMTSLKKSLSNFQHETTVLFETLKSLIAENTQSIDRLSNERSSGVAKLRSDVKILQTEVTSNRETLEQCIRESNDANLNYAKSTDKRLGRLEQRLKSLTADSSAQKVTKKPRLVTVGTQVREIDLGLKVAKCCAHDCAQSELHDEPGGFNDSGGSVMFVPPDADPRDQERDLYADRLLNRAQFTRPVGASTPSRGGQLLYTVSDQGGPRFVRVKDPPVLSLKDSVNRVDVTKSVPNSRSCDNPAPDAHPSMSQTASHRLPGSTRQTQLRTAIDTQKQSESQHSANQGPARKGGQNPPRSDGFVQKIPHTTRTHSQKEFVPQQIPTRISRVENGSSLGESSGQNDIDDFILHVRKKTRRFYVGRFTDGITEQCIRAFIKFKNGPKVDKINFFTPRDGSDVFMRLCVEVENSDVLTEPDFWPEDVRCRPWYSRNAYARNVRQSRNTRDDQS